MRTAILSALLAVLSALGSWAQDAPKPPAAPPAGTDPAKMAAPKASRDAKIPGAAPVDIQAYVLGAEDVIAVVVWGSPEFSASHMIRPDGKISINLIGEVAAAGLTPAELSGALKELLKKYVVDPDVTVSVAQVNSKKYFIHGEVNKPGDYKLVIPTRVLEALVNAAGFRDFANKKNITVMRGSERMKFNYEDVIRGKHPEQNIYLQPGDIIIVK